MFDSMYFIVFNVLAKILRAYRVSNPIVNKTSFEFLGTHILNVIFLCYVHAMFLMNLRWNGYF